MRGFFGFSVASEMAAELAGFVRTWPADPALRPVFPADLHVTIKFLSEFSSEVFVRGLPGLQALGPPPAGALRAGRIAVWPSVVVLEGEASPALVKWHGEVNAFLEAQGFIKERHPRFQPHVTLARRRATREIAASTARYLTTHENAYLGAEIPLRAPALFQSQAEETGRKHRPILSPLFSLRSQIDAGPTVNS